MKKIKAAAIVASLFLGFALRVSGQSGWWSKAAALCPSLQNANHDDLVRFLSNSEPNDQNKYCIAWAIMTLGDARYEPAIPVLVKLVDFRGPKTPDELRLGTGHFFPPLPAFTALKEIAVDTASGKDNRAEILSALLDALKSDSSSASTRTRLIFVWVQLHKSPSEGIARLKQEELKASDDAAKERLESAVQEAAAECLGTARSPEETAACRQAAEKGTLPGTGEETQ